MIITESEGYGSIIGVTMNKNGQPVVMVSHSLAEQSLAQKLVKALVAAGFNVWSDQQILTSGPRWWEEIEDAMERVQAIVLLVGPADQDPRQEVSWQTALKATWAGRNQMVIPFLVKGAEGPAFLRTWHAVHAGRTKQEWNAALKRLIEILRSDAGAASRLQPVSKADRLAFKKRLTYIGEMAEALRLETGKPSHGKR